MKFSKSWKEKSITFEYEHHTDLTSFLAGTLEILYNWALPVGLGYLTAKTGNLAYLLLACIPGIFKLEIELEAPKKKKV